VLFTACRVCTFLMPADFGEVLLHFHQALHKLKHETCRTPNKRSLTRLFFDVTRHVKGYNNTNSAISTVLAIITLCNDFQSLYHCMYSLTLWQEISPNAQFSC
jgi:hypothetical protein